jgi:hypothetical protein
MNHIVNLTAPYLIPRETRPASEHMLVGIFGIPGQNKTKQNKEAKGRKERFTI